LLQAAGRLALLIGAAVDWPERHCKYSSREQVTLYLMSATEDNLQGTIYQVRTVTERNILLRNINKQVEQNTSVPCYLPRAAVKQY
jgi:hypothetical protein